MSAYADMGFKRMDKIENRSRRHKSKTFLNNNIQPALIVIDLKHGSNLSGTMDFGLMGELKGTFLMLRFIETNEIAKLGNVKPAANVLHDVDGDFENHLPGGYNEKKCD
jgi:hypothetical protein